MKMTVFFFGMIIYEIRVFIDVVVVVFLFMNVVMSQGLGDESHYDYSEYEHGSHPSCILCSVYLRHGKEICDNYSNEEHSCCSKQVGLDNFGIDEYQADSNSNKDG